jgi:hypothetical protein
MDGVGPTIVARRSTPGADAAQDLLTPDDYTELVSGRTERVPRELYLASAYWRAELAARAGLPTTPTDELYDVVIVGAGRAGLTAAVAAERSGSRAVRRPGCALRIGHRRRPRPTLAVTRSW